MSSPSNPLLHWLYCTYYNKYVCFDHRNHIRYKLGWWTRRLVCCNRTSLLSPSCSTSSDICCRNSFLRLWGFIHWYVIRSQIRLKCVNLHVILKVSYPTFCGSHNPADLGRLTVAVRSQSITVCRQWAVLLGVYVCFVPRLSYLILITALWKVAVLQLQTGNNVTSFSGTQSDCMSWFHKNTEAAHY